MILSAQIGKPVTAAQLLGEEKEELEQVAIEARAKAAQLMRKMEKAGIRTGSKKRLKGK
jgi:hypothetical protein